MMKSSRMFLLMLAILMAVSSANASQKDSLCVEPVPYRINTKLSALAVIGIVNPAVEFSLSKKWSMQFEGLATFAGNNFLNTGYPLQLTSIFAEGRYYFKRVFNGFFVAPNFGVGTFRMNKNILYKFFGWSPDLDYEKPENSVQIGSSMMGGVTLGYVHTFKKNPHWSVEINWSMGRQWARYEYYGFDEEGNVTGHTPMNGSAEYMPLYRGGIFIAYKW